MWSAKIPVKYATKINRVISIGTTLHKLINSNGREAFLPCVSYHLTQTDVQLLSPQTYHHTHGGYYEVYNWWVGMYLTDHRINIPIHIENKNLPIFYMSDNKKRFIGPHMRSAISHTKCFKLDIVGDLRSINNLWCHGLLMNDAIFNNELEYYYNFCGPCFGAPANQNIIGP